MAQQSHPTTLSIKKTTAPSLQDIALKNLAAAMSPRPETNMVYPPSKKLTPQETLEIIKIGKLRDLIYHLFLTFTDIQKTNERMQEFDKLGFFKEENYNFFNDKNFSDAATAKANFLSDFLQFFVKFARTSPNSLSKNLAYACLSAWMKELLLAEKATEFNELRKIYFPTQYDRGFRDTPDQLTLDLSGIELSDKNFKNFNLIGVKFTNAKLTDCDFSKTKLAHSVFKDATLTNCNFRDCEGYSADFSQASLSNCDFSAVKLRRADFSKSKLKKINFQNAELCNSIFASPEVLENIDFSGANLIEAFFSNINLEKINLEKANYLNKLQLSIVQLNNKDLSGKDFSEVSFYQTSLQHTNLTNTKFYTATLYECSLEDANLEKTNFCKAKLTNCVAAKANCNQTDFTHATLKNSQFMHKGLTKSPGPSSFAKINNTNFTDATLEDITFSACDNNSTLHHLPLKKVILTNCKINNPTFLLGEHQQKHRFLNFCSLWHSPKQNSISPTHPLAEIINLLEKYLAGNIFFGTKYRHHIKEVKTALFFIKAMKTESTNITQLNQNALNILICIFKGNLPSSGNLFNALQAFCLKTWDQNLSQSVSLITRPK